MKTIYLKDGTIEHFWSEKPCEGYTRAMVSLDDLLLRLRKIREDSGCIMSPESMGVLRLIQELECGEYES